MPRMRSCVSTALTTLFNTAGGRVLDRSNAMQRRYRDMIAVASHWALTWDSVSSDYGKFLLGDPASRLVSSSRFDVS